MEQLEWLNLVTWEKDIQQLRTKYDINITNMLKSNKLFELIKVKEDI